MSPGVYAKIAKMSDSVGQWRASSWACSAISYTVTKTQTITHSGPKESEIVLSDLRLHPGNWIHPVPPWMKIVAVGHLSVVVIGHFSLGRKIM